MGAERVGGSGGDFEAFAFWFPDPAGDTLAHETATTIPALDVTDVAGVVDGTTLLVELTFSSSVAPWSHQSAGSVDGFIDFDLDENSATGIPGAAGEYGGSAPLGAEFYISLRDVEPGYVAIIDVMTGQYRIVPAAWNGTKMTMRIPRSRLADADGQFRMSIVVGHPQQPATDFVPSEGFYTVHR